MLETLMKFGSYRIDRFEKAEITGNEFGFYIRPRMRPSGGYYADAKSQLYYGLAIIYTCGELANLAGVYIDIDELDNLQRPAYRAMIKDIKEGRFSKVLIIEREALLGSIGAEADLFNLCKDISGLELFRFQAGEREVFPMFAELIYEMLG